MTESIRSSIVWYFIFIQINVKIAYIDVKYRGVPINNTDDYIYLGHALDKSLTLRDRLWRSLQKVLQCPTTSIKVTTPRKFGRCK